MNFDEYLHTIETHNGIVDSQKLFDFSIDYGLIMADKSNRPREINNKINPYVMEKSEIMLKRITESVVTGYYHHRRPVNLNVVLDGINLLTIINKESSHGR